MSKAENPLEERIAAFFAESGTSATREQCDEFARNEFGGPVQPVQLQGMASYTVMVGLNKIVQFREQSSPLGEDMLALAKATHPDVVASCTWHGHINESKSSRKATTNELTIYSMDKLPGHNYIYVRGSLAECFELQLATVKSLANFFAQSWLHGRSTDPSELSAVANECSTLFRYLSDTLPDRFKPAATEIIQRLLPTLRSGEYPVVLTHGDLNEMNILVDPISGKITGVCDWAEASFLPFGFALFALDNTLGSMGPNGWEYFQNADYLEGEFWRTFGTLVGGLSEPTMESIRLARIAGLLIRYGTPYNSGFKGIVGVLDSSGASLQYLDALLPGEVYP